jgi:flagellar export protein FliJ
MTRTLDAAVRWRKQRLDDLRRDLGKLFNRQEELQAQLSEIDKELSAEATAASGMALANFSAFHARNRVAHNATLDRLDQLEVEIDGIRTLVREAFEDYKAVDVAAERQVENARLEGLRQEQGELDDVAAQRHNAANG